MESPLLAVKGTLKNLFRWKLMPMEILDKSCTAVVVRKMSLANAIFIILGICTLPGTLMAIECHSQGMDLHRITYNISDQTGNTFTDDMSGYTTLGVTPLWATGALILARQ